MLPWQRRMRDHRRQLKIKAFLGALTIYACIVFIIFFSSYKPVQRIHLTVHPNGKNLSSPVLFMKNPHAIARQEGKKSTGIKPVKKVVKQPAKKQVSKKTVQKKQPIKKKVPKKPVKKVVPKKPEIKQKPKVQSKKPAKKPVIKKPVPKKVEKVKPEAPKVIKKKVASPKKVVPKPKPEQKPEKKLESKKEPVKKQEQEKVEKTAELKSPLKQQVPVKPEEPVIEELYVSEGYEKGSRAQIALSRAVARTWKPPHGLVDDLSSQLTVKIAQDGKVAAVTIEKKSGVFAYDLSARSALWRVEYPREFWGKSVSILFGPQ